MARYLITAPKDTYAGKTLGVKFNDGKAVVDEYTVPKNLGRSPDEVARLMKRDFGFEVRKLSAKEQVEEAEDILEDQVETPRRGVSTPAPQKKAGRPKSKAPPAQGE